MLDGLLQFKSPIIRKQGILQDACGTQIRLYETGWRGIESLLVQAVNRIHEMRGEMDALKADNERIKDDVEAGYRDMERHYTEFVSDNLRLRSENERLSDDIERWRRKRDDAVRTRDTLAQENSNLLDGASKVGAENAALKARVAELEERLNSPSTFNADSVREQRRFEAACAIAPALWAKQDDDRNGYYKSKEVFAEDVREHADAIVAALDKPKATPEPKSLIDILNDEKEAMIERGKYPAAAMIRDFTQWMKDDCPTSFHWHALGLPKAFNPNIDSLHPDSFSRKPSNEPPEPPAVEVWRIDESRTIENEQWYEINKGERAANIEGLEREEVERIVAALNGGV